MTVLNIKNKTPIKACENFLQTKTLQRERDREWQTRAGINTILFFTLLKVFLMIYNILCNYMDLLWYSVLHSETEETAKSQIKDVHVRDFGHIWYTKF